MFYLVNKFSIGDAAFDICGGLGPAKRPNILIPFLQPTGDGLLQSAHSVEAAAADRLLGDESEPAFDPVEPRALDPREVQMEVRMSGQPLLTAGCL